MKNFHKDTQVFPRKSWFLPIIRNGWDLCHAGSFW